MPLQTLTLLELNRRIKSAIDDSFEAPVWVVAEINNLNVHRSGHCYLELVQKAKTKDQILAQVRATIWASKYKFIAEYFQSVTNASLSKGITVMVQVSVDFHEVYGFSLNIREIDPSYTLGDMERRKREIIEKLIADGVFEMNKSLMLPPVIQKIAIVSSAGAAGYEDFINQLNSNKYNYYFDVDLFEADMQGANTESSVVSALNRVFDNDATFDIVAILRGGGSKSDLSYFDNYNIAFHVTQFPVPVFTGIGHERDESITDMVAHTKLKTPTAVAEFIIDYNKVFENEIEYNGSQIIRTVTDILKTQESYLTAISLSMFRTKDTLSLQKENLGQIFYKIRTAASHQMRDQRYYLTNFKAKIVNVKSVIIKKSENDLDVKLKEISVAAKNSLLRAKAEMTNVEQKLNLSDPENLLKRGYSITRLNGKSISSNTDIKQGDEIETISHKNKILSKITKVNSK